MNSRIARFAGLFLIILLVFVGFGIADRLRSQAILFHLVPHCGLFHPDRPEDSDTDGRFRLDPNNDSLPSGPEPLSQADVEVWMADQWPGIEMSKPQVYTSGSKGRVQYRLVEFDVMRHGRRSPASLICVRNEEDPLFRGFVVIHDREGSSYTMDSVVESHLLRPPLRVRLVQSVAWEWQLIYPEPNQ